MHAPAVEVLASEGVFEDTECGLGLFCPRDPILRWQMAVWLVRVLDEGAEPEAVGSSRFADVDAGVWWAPYVERLADLGVTRGCATGPLRYCPQEAVTRAQMASFLVRAFDLLPGPPAGFSDVSGSGVHYDDINALAYSGVTKGCTGGMFCPSDDTTRAEMASFLVRARGVEERPVSVMVHETEVMEVVEAAGGSGFGDPYEPELPGVVEASETVAWLQGEGGPVVGLVAEAASLWAGHAPDCEAVAVRLGELGTPSDLRDAALGVPDPVTAELLVAAHLGVVEMLRSCGDTSTSSEQAWQWVVAYRRLVELGVIGECSEPGCGGFVTGLGERPAAGPAVAERPVVGSARSYPAGLRPKVTVAVSNSVASLFPAVAAPAVVAANGSQTLSWQSAGDSYSAGQGLRDREGICARSPRAYGPTAADLLDDRGWDIRSETYVACSGAVIEQYANGWTVPFGPSYLERVGICVGNPLCAVALPGGTSSVASQWEQSQDQRGPDRVDVITMSFGGNDIGFADVLYDCVHVPDSWMDLTFGLSGCDIAEWELRSRIDHLLNPSDSCAGRGPRYRLGGADRYNCDLDLGDERGSITDFYVKVVEEKLTDRGQLYVVGYPKLFAPTSEWPGWVKASCQSVLSGDTEKLGRVAEHLNSQLKAAVSSANSRLGGTDRVHYIDLVELYRANQAELCGTSTDWLHGLFAPPVTKCCSYHPNTEGYRKTAELLADVIDRSFNSCPTRSDNRGLLAYRLDASSLDRPEIWTMDAATGASRCRPAQDAWQPAWSPDGRRLAFVHKPSSQGDNEVWVMNPDGTNWRNLTDNDSAEYQPAWSPDGTRIAYLSDRSGNLDVWVMNADGSGQRNLTNHPARDNQPDWSPDGTKIAFVSNRDGGDSDIWVMNADGTDARNLHDNNDEENQPTWSPDGTRIAFAHNQNEPGHRDEDIWVMDTDGTNWRNLTNHPADDTDPAWSPDGTRIAFVSDRSGNDDIWLVNPDGTNPQNLTNTPDQNEDQPAWSPPTEDDREIRISWGSDASSRADCPEDTTCWNLEYEYVGSWEPPPYTLECWENGQKGWVGQWSGRSATGCYYWGQGTAHVVIDGIRSNQLTIPTPDDREVRISWGSDASSRADCPEDTTCWNLEYEYVGSWEPPPYTLECWENGQKGWVGQWSGRSATGCYYWGQERAHVVIDGIRSNTITVPTVSVSGAMPSCGTLSSGGDPCGFLAYEEAFDDNGDGYKDRFEIWVVSADGTGKRKLADGVDPTWSPNGSIVAFLARGFGAPDLAVVAMDGSGTPRALHNSVWGFIDREWLWSPDSTHVAYESMQHEGVPESDLWVAAVDGSSPPRKLVDYVASYSDRPWSPDSTHIAYTVDVDHDNDGSTETAELWVVAADGSSPPKMLSGGGGGSYGAAWAPVGSRIAFPAWSISKRGTVLHHESLGLRVADADGTDEHTIADRGETPQWSPDGQRIAYAHSGQLWIAPADGSGTPRKIVDRQFGFGWSPDGRRIAYHVSVDTDGDGRRDSWELRVTTSDGAGKHIQFAAKASMLNLFVTGAPRQSEPWSIDGTHLVYAVPAQNAVLHRGKYHHELWVARSDGSDRACRLATTGALREWSPSGQHVVYNVPIDDDGDNMADRNSWWVARADCTGARKLTDGGWVDGWSPNGTHIAYSVPVDSNNDGEADRLAVWIVDIVGGSPLLVTDNAPVYTSPGFNNPTWSPRP